MIDEREQFLEAWLRISSTVCNERIVSNMPFNEALVCNILYYFSMMEPDRELTATDLCQMAHMHKTLMNRTLNNLEKKKIIRKEQDDSDKRRSFVKIDDTNFEEFIRVHNDTMEFVNKVVKVIGMEKMKNATQAFHDVAQAVDDIMYKKAEE